MDNVIDRAQEQYYELKEVLGQKVAELGTTVAASLGVAKEKIEYGTYNTSVTVSY